MRIRERWQLDLMLESKPLAVESDGTAWLQRDETSDDDRAYLRLGPILNLGSDCVPPDRAADLARLAADWLDAQGRRGESRREQEAAYGEAKGI